MNLLKLLVKSILDRYSVVKWNNNLKYNNLKIVYLMLYCLRKRCWKIVFSLIKNLQDNFFSQFSDNYKKNHNWNS